MLKFTVLWKKTNAANILNLYYIHKQIPVHLLGFSNDTGTIQYIELLSGGKNLSLRMDGIQKAGWVTTEEKGPN